MGHFNHPRTKRCNGIHNRREHRLLFLAAAQARTPGKHGGRCRTKDSIDPRLRFHFLTSEQHRTRLHIKIDFRHIHCDTILQVWKQQQLDAPNPFVLSNRLLPLECNPVLSRTEYRDHMAQRVRAQQHGSGIQLHISQHDLARGHNKTRRGFAFEVHLATHGRGKRFIAIGSRCVNMNREHLHDRCIGHG